jgi:SAM-dependent methyltransferase
MVKKRILNLGCGSETYGTDFVDTYPSRKEVVKCDLIGENLPYRSGSFDEVYSKNLFEHIPNPIHILSETRRVLKKGGRLFFLTDNAGFLIFHIPIRKNKFG